MRKWERGHDTGGKREAGLIRLTGPTVLRSDLREDVKKTQVLYGQAGGNSSFYIFPEN